MGWCLLGLGCLSLGFAGWMIWDAFQRGNGAVRTEKLKFAAVFGIGAIVPFGLSAMYFFDIGAHLTLSQMDVVMRVVGAGMALMGVWVAWYGPHTSRQAYEERFHGASSLPALQRAVTVFCVAMGVFLLFTGILILTMSYPFTAIFVVLGAIGVAGAIVAIGAACTAAIIEDRLKMDAQIAAWRERRRGVTQ